MEDKKQLRQYFVSDRHLKCLNSNNDNIVL